MIPSPRSVWIGSSFLTREGNLLYMRVKGTVGASLHSNLWRVAERVHLENRKGHGVFPVGQSDRGPGKLHFIELLFFRHHGCPGVDPSREVHRLRRHVDRGGYEFNSLVVAVIGGNFLGGGGDRSSVCLGGTRYQSGAKYSTGLRPGRYLSVHLYGAYLPHSDPYRILSGEEELVQNKKFAHPSRNISRPGSTPGGDSIIRKEVGKSPAY